MDTVVRSTLRTLRASQPLNWLATASVRKLLQATRGESEFAVKHLPRVGTVRSCLPNGRELRLWSRGDDWIANQVYWRGWDGYERETSGWFFRLASEARVTLDVGAYVGYFSLLAAHANPAGMVYAFEPLPAAFRRLQHNLAMNGLTNLHCVERAVGDTEGEVEFYHPPEGLPSSSGLSLAFVSEAAGEIQKRLVRIVTLDAYVSEMGLPHVDLIKMDTETTEPAVVRGMFGILTRFRPAVITEVLPGQGTDRSLDDLLKPHNYRRFLITANALVERERIQADETWRNYLFWPGERPEPGTPQV